MGRENEKINSWPGGTGQWMRKFLRGGAADVCFIPRKMLTAGRVVKYNVIKLHLCCGTGGYGDVLCLVVMVVWSSVWSSVARRIGRLPPHPSFPLFFIFTLIFRLYQGLHTNNRNRTGHACSSCLAGNSLKVGQETREIRSWRDGPGTVGVQCFDKAGR